MPPLIERAFLCDMRAIAASLLVFVILSASFRSTAVYVWFQINQTYIAANLCVNRDNPESLCGGSCVLKTRMAEAQEQEKESPYINLNDTKPITLIPIQYNKYDQDGITSQKSQKPFTHDFALSTDHHKLVFRPPQC